MFGKANATARSWLRNGFHRFGYDLVKFPCAAAANQAYAPITPFATYSPWNLDTAFVETYQAIRAHTLVDIYRCYELWTLVAQSAKTPGDIIEVGVWKGGTGALLARKAELAGLDCVVYLCDTFCGVAKAGDQDTCYRGGEHSDTSRALVERLTSQTMGLRNVRVIEGIFPDASASQIAPGARFRLCHIDVDVYQSAKDILHWVWDRLDVGGIVVFDDYGFSGCQGITRLVDEQAGAPDRLVLHNLNGHALMIKLVHRGAEAAVAPR